MLYICFRIFNIAEIYTELFIIHTEPGEVEAPAIPALTGKRICDKMKTARRLRMQSARRDGRRRPLGEELR